MMHRKTYLISALSCVAACASYEREPLEPEEFLQSLLTERGAPRDDVSLKTSVDWMLQNNRRIVAARGTWQAAHALAKVSTPLANPSFSFGPAYLTGSGASPWGVDVGLGWLLPVFGTRGILDDRKESLARAALVDAVATAREEYLALRADLLAVVYQTDRLGAERQMLGWIRPSIERQRALGSRATISAVELKLLELDLAARVSRVESVRAAEIESRGRLAGRCGVAAADVAELPAQARPEIPAELPTVESLRELLPEHPDLARLRARYETAEHDLRLAVRRQYPDLTISGELETGGGQTRYVLPLGLDLPLFDRNQGPIAKARASRAALRDRFYATMRKRLTALTVAHRALEVQHRRYRDLDRRTSDLLAATRSAIEAAVGGGTMSAMQRADALSQLTEAELARLSARRDLYQAWLALEQSCGAPLLRFPGEPDPTDIPSPIPNQNPAGDPPLNPVSNKVPK